MNLEKAIALCSLTTSITPLVHPPDEHEAIKLLIEAGKRLESNRSHITTEAWILLPGETED